MVFGHSISFAQETHTAPEEQFLAAGVGVVENQAGMPLQLYAAKKIFAYGVIPKYDDQILVEANIGPLLTKGENSMGIASAHVRWDLLNTSRYAVFAMGGIGSSFKENREDNPFKAFPRYGAGAYLRLHQNLWMRGELGPKWGTVTIAHGI